MAEGFSVLDRILVVDDEPLLRQLVRRILAPAQVTEAANGEDALRLAMELELDLIITDFDMPLMRGDSLVRALRQQARLDDVRILLLTGVNDERMRVDLLRNGAQDYLVKPFSNDELAARARNLLSAKHGRDALHATITHQRGHLAAARDEVSRAGEARTAFLQLVAHELRTPLTSVRLNLALLERDGRHTDERQRRRVRRLGQASERLMRTVESVLDYTGRAGARDAAATAVDLGVILASLVDGYREKAAAKGLSLAADLAPDLSSWSMQPRIARCVFGNVLDNAIKFTDAGGIQVTATRAGEDCRVEISDTGRGLAESALSSMFEAFHTAEPIRNKHDPGLSLGLATVSALLDTLGGGITIASKPGIGTMVQITLPAQPRA